MSEPLTAEEALRQIREWCDDSRESIAAKHGSEQRLLFAVIPALCDATLDAAREGPGLDVRAAAEELLIVLDDTYPEDEIHPTPLQAMANLRAALAEAQQREGAGE